MTTLLMEKGWTKDDLIGSVNDFSADDLQAFVPKIFTDGVYVDSIVFGNITRQVSGPTKNRLSFFPYKTLFFSKKAVDMMDKLEAQLSTIRKPRALLPQQLNNYRHVLLPNKADFVLIKENKIHKTVGIETYYQCKEQSTRNNVLTELFCQIINEATYNVLRTQEQLG
jgi:insulysin